MDKIAAQRKTTNTHTVVLHDDGRADGAVICYLVSTRKLRNGVPFGPTSIKRFSDLGAAGAAYSEAGR